MTSDVREGVCFVVATSAPSLPRHDGDPAPVDGDGRVRPALDLQEIGGRHSSTQAARPSRTTSRSTSFAPGQGQRSGFGPTTVSLTGFPAA